MDIPRPFDIDELVARVSRRRGRPIELRPVRTPASGPSGLWVATREADHIFYESETSALHSEHIILHELGHLLCGHESGVTPDVVLRLLMPTLDPAVVRGALSRTGYRDRDERQAELFAMLVLERAGRLPPASGLPAEAHELLIRVEEAMTPR
ncbi:hypothetical protein ALI22I_37790 [Saccharothrix sp. ALI-22-I]|nr:hypothetical protein ALI22I_37790 [Saccharothrix sp. ALI-22-I]